MRLKGLLLILFFVARISGAQLEPLEEAEKRSLKEGKPLMIFFLGSGWCHWCEEMKKKILTKRDFMRNVEKHFIVIEVDFPKGGGRKKVENGYKFRFGVNRYPTLVIYDPKSEKIFRESGFIDLSPKEYAARLKEKFFDEKTVSTGFGWPFQRRDEAKEVVNYTGNQEPVQDEIELDLNAEFVWVVDTPQESKMAPSWRVGFGCGLFP